MNSTQTLKISISGVRGVVGESLTPGLLVRFSQSFGTYLGAGTIVVGRDTRTSGEMVKHAVLSGLLATGCRVIDLDIVPVPTVQFMVRKLKARGGVAITASHNPAQWNALKFIREDGCFLNGYQARELLEVYHQGEYRKAPSSEIHQPRAFANATTLHADAILANLGRLPVKGKPIHVVIDSVNGAGSVMAKTFLERLGCKVTAINSEPNGIFPRPPEPLPQNLSDLCEAVVKHNADVGFAQDADADRLAAVSEKGIPIGEDYTLALAIDCVLAKQKGAVVVNLSTSKLADDIAAKHGCRIMKSKIGEINVTEMMRLEKAVIGGEGNGGVIYPAVNLARDSFTGMAIILHHIARKKKKVSEIVAELPYYAMHKTSLTCPGRISAEVMEALTAKYRGKNVDLTDGIKITKGKTWALIRSSNTEPILRIITEAPSQDGAEKLANSYVAEVKSIINRLSS